MLALVLKLLERLSLSDVDVLTLVLVESEALTEADTLVLRLALADRDSLTLSDAKSFSLARADALVLKLVLDES